MYEALVSRLRDRARREDEYYAHGGDVINEAADAIEELSGLVDHYGGETGIKDLEEYASKYWNLLKNVPRWISVKERLPEKYDCYYLVVLNNWNTDFCLYTKERGFGMYITQKWWDANDEVTHWMPLPESPKEVT